jgi:hypothetical protein
MVKLGLIHDYDLMANAEPAAAGVKCAVCDTQPTRFQWSDYSGEGMCQACGCTYQLKWGSDEQVKENKYPYMTIKSDFVPLAREFWQTQKVWVHYGSSFSRSDGHRELAAWLKKEHPEYVSK